jgi:uncharacterized DUF497 family protein
MQISFDPAKSRRNIELRGLAFDLVAAFDFDSARIEQDDRRDYGEIRYRAIGQMDGRLAALVFTMRGPVLRVISLRLASRQERERHEKEQS